MPLLRFVLWCLARIVLSLRYRVHLRGAEHLEGISGKALVLPNHPAMIDPPIMLMMFWRRLGVRPTLLESNFNSPILWPLMTILNAVRIPDLDRPGVDARQRARQAIDQVIDGLKQGENHILWPSGVLQRSGVERLGAATALTEILQAVPDAVIVRVRTRGLWGSSFSYAYSGQRPNVVGGLFQGLGVLLANLLLFTPRRDVTITIEVVDRDTLPELTRDNVNRTFEHWYNLDGPEQPTFLPYHFLFGPRTYTFPEPPQGRIVELDRIKPATKQAIAELLGEVLGQSVDASELTAETPLDELGLDSLTRMSLMLAVEERFGFPGDEAPSTVGEVWALAQGLADSPPVKSPPSAWWRHSPSTGTLAQIDGNTILEAFVTRALAHPRDAAVADDLSGVLTYRTLLIGAMIMARHFRRIDAPNVGLMLPASVGCDLALLGLMFAGKLPVLLNWTTGPANLAHAARTLELTHVVTSKVFRDRAHVSIEGVEFVDLEDVRRSIGFWQKFRTALALRLVPGWGRQQIPTIQPDQPAVVLFTSGSERAPKAVPLTHQNILSNQRGILSAVSVTRDDIVFGFLPAFHSFGLTVTGLLPLLAGLRVVRHPNPTDAGALVRKTTAYKPTLMLSTPTFLRYIVERVKGDELASLRLIIVGAEKCPLSLFDTIEKFAPKARLLEGYGVTECSPVVTVNTPDASRPGTVGRALPGVEICLIDPDSNETVPPGQRGMLLVSGPTVFPGYINHDGDSPFVERDGKRWYMTGDLVERDEDGYITFRGRQKRFLKVAGEMVSLEALEAVFQQRYPPTEDGGVRVAVEGIDHEGERDIRLFTTEAITLSEANAQLQEAGFRGVMRLDHVQQLDEMPTLGGGVKVDYKRLRSMILEN